jgi:ribosomal protein L7Ae-like RNA K-turn-binding protein
MLFLALAIAVSFSIRAKKITIPIVAMVLLLTSLVTSFGNLDSPSLMKGNNDYRGAGRFISKMVDNHSLVVIANSASALIYKHYLDIPSEKSVEYVLVDTSEELDAVCRKVEKMDYSQVLFFTTTPSTLMNSDSFNCNYMQKIDSPTFASLAVYRYLKMN